MEAGVVVQVARAGVVVGALVEALEHAASKPVSSK